MDRREEIAAVLRYEVPPCVGCAATIQDTFRFHLEKKMALPGEAGVFHCPDCGLAMTFRLADRAELKVLPYVEREAYR